MARVLNFSAGPSALPLPALELAQRELLDFEGTGASILEQSHRGADYLRVHEEALALTRELLRIPDTHEIVFLQGGATTQFALVPMNFLRAGESADYVVTDVWGEKALAEAKTIGNARVAATTIEGGRYPRVPRSEEINRDPNAAYLHLTTNNTIAGTQFHELPESGSVPLVLDASSDILARPIDFGRVALVYAGAQKNLGPPGVAVVIAKKSWLAGARTDIPKIFRYAAHAAERSVLHTAPVFSIYLLRNVMRWVKAEGGLDAMDRRAKEKSRMLYECIDSRADYYRSPVERESRSRMNVVFRLPTPELDAKFVADSKAAGMIGLKGHKLVGGIRASIYNAVSVPDVEKLVQFMDEFARKNG